MSLVKQQQQTMSSREIAELTGKELKHIHRDIQRMFEQLGIDDPNLDHDIERDNRGYIKQYNLPRRECEILITGYDVKRRAAVIDRWFALESGQANPVAHQHQPLDPVLADCEAMANHLICLTGVPELRFLPVSNTSA